MLGTGIKGEIYESAQQIWLLGPPERSLPSPPSVPAGALPSARGDLAAARRGRARDEPGQCPWPAAMGRARRVGASAGLSVSPASHITRAGVW